ncbi:MAG: HEAT repeat protein [Acidimicrobiales bacterium]|jgi:hypothetical protein
MLEFIQQLAWVIAGISVGLLALTIGSTLSSARSQVAPGEQRKALWTTLLDSLAALSADPENLLLRAKVINNLGTARSVEDELEVVALVLSLQHQHPFLVELVRESGLVDVVVEHIELGTDDHKIGALELIGLVGDEQQLSTVLMECTSANPTIRRVALRTLSDMAPVSALDLHVRAIRSEGPWALEQLIELLKNQRTVEDYRSLHGDRRVADVVALLASEIAVGDERRSLAAIEALELIDHRASLNALGEGLRSASPIVKEAAAAALVKTTAGRVIVDRHLSAAGARPVEAKSTKVPTPQKSRRLTPG